MELKAAETEEAIQTEEMTEPEEGAETMTDEARAQLREVADDIIAETGIPAAFAELSEKEQSETDQAKEAQSAADAPRTPTNDEAALRVSQLVTGIQKEREFLHTCFDPIPDDKVREMAEQMAKHLQEAADLENEAKEIAKDFKERIQIQERAAHAIGRRVTLNHEEVVVECTEYFDRDLGRAYVVRNDTFEVVVNRPLMLHERQLYMQFPDDGADSAADNIADTGEAETDGETAEAGASSDGGEVLEEDTTEDSEPDKPLSRAEARKRAKALRDAAAEAASEDLPAAA